MPFARRPDHWAPASLPSRPRVLIEHSDLGVAFAAERVLDRDGYDVAVCGGPLHLRRERCPLVDGTGCALVEQADVIVQGLNLSRDVHCEVTRAVREHRPELPVVIEATADDASRHAPLLEGCTTVPFPMTRAGLEDAVRGALRKRTLRSTPPTPPAGRERGRR